jgi:hypothetical protein
MFEGLLTNPTLTKEQTDFIKHELELLAKKNSSDKKPTAQQTANAKLKQSIFECMEDNRLYSVTEMIKEFPCCADLSNPKVSAMVSQMVADKVLVRTEVKRRAYFSKAKVVEEEEETPVEE